MHLFLASLLRAESTEVKEKALIVNPTLPAITILADGLVSLTEFEDFLKLRVWDVNLRGYQVFNQRWGLSVQVDFTRANIISTSTHFGCRVGPRISLQNSGITGWNWTPFVMTGHTSVYAGNYPLSKWGVLGIGGELDRTYVWNNFVLDLGLGLYTTRNVLYRTYADAFDGSELQSDTSFKPIFHTGIGYAF